MRVKGGLEVIIFIVTHALEEHCSRFIYGEPKMITTRARLTTVCAPTYERLVAPQKRLLVPRLRRIINPFDTSDSLSMGVRLNAMSRARQNAVAEDRGKKKAWVICGGYVPLCTDRIAALSRLCNICRGAEYFDLRPLYPVGEVLQRHFASPTFPVDAYRNKFAQRSISRESLEDWKSIRTRVHF